MSGVALTGSPGAARGTSSPVTGAYGQAPSAGHVLVAAVTWLSTALETFGPSASAGWARLWPAATGNNPSGTAHAGVDFWWKAAAGSDAAPAFTQASGATTAMTVVIYELAGANGSAPLDTSGLYQSGGTALASPPVMSLATAASVAAAGGFAISAYVQDDQAAGTRTWSEGGSGYTSAFSDAAVSSSGHSQHNYKAGPATGSACTDSGGFTTSTANTYAAAGLVVIAAAPSLTGTGTAAAGRPSASGTGRAEAEGSGTAAGHKPGAAASGWMVPSGAGTAAGHRPAGSAAGSFTPLAGTGTATAAALRPSASAAGTAAAPLVTGTGTAAARRPGGLGSGAERFAGTGTAAAARPAGSGSGRASASGTAAVSAARPAAAAAAHFSPLAVTGAAAGRAAKPSGTSRGWAAVTGPGTAAVSRPRAAAAGLLPAAVLTASALSGTATAEGALSGAAAASTPGGTAGPVTSYAGSVS